MLILSRRRGEAIVLDGGIRIVVLDCDRQGTRIGIEAPSTTNILREELLQRVAEENQRARAQRQQQWAKTLPLQVTPVTSAGHSGGLQHRKAECQDGTRAGSRG